MRQSDRPAWQRFLGQLRARGVDPSHAAIAKISLREPDPQHPVWLVARGLGRTILVYSTAYDTLDELEARWFWDRDRALPTVEAILGAERLGGLSASPSTI